MAEVEKSDDFNRLDMFISSSCNSRLMKSLRPHGINILFILLLVISAFFYTYQLDKPVLGALEYDEGLKMMIARLVANGYPLYSQIFTDNSPLYIGLIASGIRIFGTNPIFSRAIIVCFGLSGILGVYILGREIAGHKTGLLGAIFLVFSYRWFEYSRLVMEEVPSAALQIFTVFALLKCLNAETEQYEIRWAVFTGVFLTAAALMKTFTALNFFLVLPLLVFYKRNWKIIGAFFVGWAIPLLVFLPLDIGAAFESMILHPINRPMKTDLARNWQIMRTFFWPFWPYNENDRILIASWPEGNVSALAIIGLFIAWFSKKRDQRLVAMWALFQAGYLLLWTSLYFHHVVLLVPFIPVLAALSATPLRNAIYYLRDHLNIQSNGYFNFHFLRGVQRRQVIQFFVISFFLITEIIILTGFAVHPDRVIEKDLNLAEIGPGVGGEFPSETPDWYEALDIIQTHSTPNDWIISDAPNLIYLADRLIVPELCDSTLMRIASGFLTAEYAIEMTEQYNVSLIVFWPKKLTTLTAFVDYVNTNFTLIWDGGSNNQIYVRTII